MIIFNRGTLKKYWKKYPDTEKPLTNWFNIISENTFKNPNQIMVLFKKTADTIGNGLIIFDIRGDSHRLIVKFNYKTQKALIRFLGTHKEYNKVDAKKL